MRDIMRDAALIAVVRQFRKACAEYGVNDFLEVYSHEENRKNLVSDLLFLGFVEQVHRVDSYGTRRFKLAWVEQHRLKNALKRKALPSFNKFSVGLFFQFLIQFRSTIRPN